MKEAISEIAIQYLANQNRVVKATPFLKWAGGKGQLINQLIPFLPYELYQGQITKYCEPFIGGGALFFYISQIFNLKEKYVSDINQDLILVFKTICKDVNSLINILIKIEEEYKNLNDIEQSTYYYHMRDLFNKNVRNINANESSSYYIERAAQIIFMNRTCFNGLFRTNSCGQFNVPFGKYKNPRICQSENLKSVSLLLQNSIIENGDFENCESFIDNNTFIYLDPPYRPISKSSNFTSYTSNIFGDQEQIRLSNFFRRMDNKGAKILLSNSDPKNSNADDNFFDNLYSNYEVSRVKANRMINCDSTRRGPISEIVITNYSI